MKMSLLAKIVMAVGALALGGHRAWATSGAGCTALTPADNPYVQHTSGQGPAYNSDNLAAHWVGCPTGIITTVNIVTTDVGTVVNVYGNGSTVSCNAELLNITTGAWYQGSGSLSVSGIGHLFLYTSIPGNSSPVKWATTAECSIPPITMTGSPFEITSTDTE